MGTVHGNFDNDVLGVGNSNHPANYTDEQIEKMTDLEYLEYERNKYQKELHELKTYLKSICGKDSKNGLAVLILNKLK